MPRQPLMASLVRLAGAAAIAVVASPVFAQYSISATGTPSGPGTCDVGNVLVPMTGGSLTLTLPPPPNNIVFTSRVNGGPVFTALSTNSSGTNPKPTFGFEVSPPTIPPYTLVQSFFPASGGAATGTGVVFTITCSATGVASLSFVDNVPASGGGNGGGGPASASLAIPALSPLGLVALMALLAATAVFAMTRRRG